MISQKYKNTEVGIIPEDWEVRKLGEIAFIKRGKFTPRPRNNPIYYGGNIPFVQTGDVTKSNGKIIDFTQTLNEEGLAVSTLFKKGTILMTIAANIGYTGILQIDMACPDSLVAIDGLGKTDNDFLNFYFSFKREKLEELATTGAQMNLNIERLSPFNIPIPPTKAEQTAIATALSDADALISSLEKIIAKKRNIKRGAMQKLLQPKEGWEVKKLGEVLEKIIGGGTPSRSNKEFWGDEIPWVTVKDFATFNSHFTQEYITKKGLENSASHLIPKGILVTPTRMGLGKAVIYNVDVSINQDLKALFPSKQLDTLFLYFWFEKNSELIEKMGSGSTVMGISLNELRNIDFYLPSITEQTRIATILSDMDNEITALETKLEKYRKVKLGMMQNLLTGKIRLV